MCDIGYDIFPNVEKDHSLIICVAGIIKKYAATADNNGNLVWLNFHHSIILMPFDTGLVSNHNIISLIFLLKFSTYYLKELAISISFHLINKL